MPKTSTIDYAENLTEKLKADQDAHRESITDQLKAIRDQKDLEQIQHNKLLEYVNKQHSDRIEALDSNISALQDQLIPLEGVEDPILATKAAKAA